MQFVSLGFEVEDCSKEKGGREAGVSFDSTCLLFWFGLWMRWPYLSCAVTRLGELPIVMACERVSVLCWSRQSGEVRLGIGRCSVEGAVGLVHTRHAHDDDPGKRGSGCGTDL